MPMLKKDKNRLKIQDLPEETKKTILLVTIIIIMIPLVTLWLVALKNSFAINSGPKDETFDSIKNDLGNIISNTKQSIDEINGQLNQPQISPTDLQNLKTKLLDQSLISGWQTYTDPNYNFNLKYPADSLAWEAGTSTDLINFRSIADNNLVLSVKKYNSLNDFSNDSQAKTYWQKSSYYLVVFDYANNSTTELMFNTLKFNE